MRTIFVTGVTGLIGANVARMLQERGYKVRGIVRNPKSADGRAVAATGVEVVQGDISKLDTVLKAAEGADAVIHSAAMLGGPTQSVEEGFQSNVLGTINVLTAAARLGISPVVQLLTSTYFDMDVSLTETSPFDLKTRNVDPYSLTKRIAYAEGLTRVGSGQDIRFVLPGGTYGPSVCLERAMIMPSFNERIVSGIKGQFDEIVPMKIPWVFVDDVAWIAVEALERGTAGERYIAWGRLEDAGSMAHFTNAAIRLEGLPHRVREIPVSRLDDPDIRAKYGDSWADIGKHTYPEPMWDDSFTRKRLGYAPTPLEDGLKVTLPWMHQVGLL
jgi:dihydroflavonol-4-reductase